MEPKKEQIQSKGDFTIAFDKQGALNVGIKDAKAKRDQSRKCDGTYTMEIAFTFQPQGVNQTQAENMTSPTTLLELGSVSFEDQVTSGALMNIATSFFAILALTLALFW